MRSILGMVAAAAAVALPAVAQNAISARAGMINVADGDVQIIDAKGESRFKSNPSRVNSSS